MEGGNKNTKMMIRLSPLFYMCICYMHKQSCRPELSNSQPTGLMCRTLATPMPNIAKGGGPNTSHDATVTMWDWHPCCRALTVLLRCHLDFFYLLSPWIPPFPRPRKPSWLFNFFTSILTFYFFGWTIWTKSAIDCSHHNRLGCLGNSGSWILQDLNFAKFLAQP